MNIKLRSDRLMDYFLAGFFITGLLLAPFYGTWIVAIGVGVSCLLAYYVAKIALPESSLYQYILGLVFGIFMAQFIYQMHGLFEMHFYAFIASAILITYQKWKLQLPLLLFVFIHHAGLSFLQNSGVEGVYFTQLDAMDFQVFVIHLILTVIIFFTCGLWAYQLEQYSKKLIGQVQKMASLESEAQLNAARLQNEAALRTAYQAAEKARSEADAANKAKSVFLATMSHEIRTPMNGVMGMAALLAETPLSAEQRDYTKTIVNCGDALLTVINDILDFSKIESGSLELEAENFELHTCIEEVLDVFGAKAAQARIELVYEIDTDVPGILIGDSLRLRQVLMNLVGNAVKFTEKGEIFVAAHRIKTLPDDKLELGFTVRDTGIGIAPDKTERLFKAFSQVDSSTTRKYGGTGLGLVICEKLVHLMGGHITVDSALNLGTTFTFSITVTAGVNIPRTNTTDIARMEGKTILVVEDNDLNRHILQNQLKRWNLVPTLASGAGEALDILAAGKQFDLLLTDMQMPGIDGCGLAAEAQELYPQLPRILLSSVGDENSRNCKQLFGAVLAKPVKQEQLCNVLLHQLAGRDLKVNTELHPTPQKLSVNFAKQFPLSILLAEDNKANQQLALTILRKLGYQPALAENGVETVERSTQQNFDLILMDVQMPEMDGLEATTIIRARRSPQPVIIAMTANALSEDREDCIAAGMDDFMSKPVNLNALLTLLSKWAEIILAKKKEAGIELRA